jgi:ACR3 family arsenite transporter
VALLPWNVTFQIVLLPAYLYLLVGRVIPVGIGVLFESIALFLIAPSLLSILIRRAVVATRGRAYFDGPFKSGLGRFKLWALVAVIISMFVSQNPLSFTDLKATGMLIALLIAFFAALFALALLIGRVFGLTYEDNATLAFTTTARNSEAVIGVALAAFPGHPLVYMAIILGPIVELPVLLLIAQALLSWREWIGAPAAGGEPLERELVGNVSDGA